MSNDDIARQKLEYLWTRTWWTFVILGIISVALGIFALVNPQATASLPVQLLGVFVVLDGLFKMITAVWERRYRWGMRCVGGVVEILIGALLFAWATEIVEVALTFILYLAGIGFLIAGGVSMVQAIQGRREWTALLTGALMLGFGGLLFTLTGPMAVSLVWITGIFLFGIGAVLLVAGFRIRKLGRQLGPRVKGDIVEGQVIEGAFEEDDVVEGDVKQIPDHME